MTNRSQSKTVVGVIPARWGSTRFPGKSLALICGKPLIQWVLERARQARLDSLIVATDDERIREAVAGMGAEVVMTRSDHASGTDRIAEAIQGRQADVVVNIQGDEPVIDPALINELGATLADESDWDMCTAATPIRNAADVKNPSIVKVVTASDGRALYFSRSVIPYMREEKESGADDGQPLYWRHIGVYGYRRSFLERLVAVPPSLLEKAEKLEQLRALHIGCRMKVLATEDSGLGVDTPGDVARAEAAIMKAGLI
jgi:3-deoxy-manno-octulosonate cytidylyltransferase (CMP-KDO synthetase)